MLSKQAFQELFLTPTGYWPDNATGDITPYLLRSGIYELFINETNFWPVDSSGIIAGDSSGILGAYFNPNSTAPLYREGLVFYDTENKTFALYGDQPDVALQLGQEMYTRCVNKTGVTIGNGSAVYITGAQGNRPTVGLAIADSTDVSKSKVVGFATHDILNNQEGFVTIDGVIGGLNLSGFIEGDELYLSSTISGFYTTVEPNAPTPTISIGHVLSNHHVEGKLLADIISYPCLEQLCNVDGTTALNNYILTFDASGNYWDPTDPTKQEIYYGISPLALSWSSSDLSNQNVDIFGTAYSNKIFNGDVISSGTIQSITNTFNRHVVIDTVGYTSSGNICVSGYRVDESTGNINNYQETLSIGASGYYQTNAKYIGQADVCTNDMSLSLDSYTTTYTDIRNSKFKLKGLRFSFLPSSATYDIKLTIEKINNDGSYTDLTNDEIQAANTDTYSRANIANIGHFKKAFDLDFIRGDQNEGLVVRLTGVGGGVPTNIKNVDIVIQVDIYN